MKKLLIIIILIILTGCRTVKKDWVKQNFTSKTETVKSLNSLDSIIQKTRLTTNEKLKSEFNSKLKLVSNKTTSSETSITTVKGTITADLNEEKSVTIGDTKITSKGANITFETNNNKSVYKEVIL